MGNVELGRAASVPGESKGCPASVLRTLQLRKQGQEHLQLLSEVCRRSPVSDPFSYGKAL